MIRLPDELAVFVKTEKTYQRNRCLSLQMTLYSSNLFGENMSLFITNSAQVKAVSWAVNPINGTSVLRVILQETQKTDLGENEVTYDNKTKTKSLPGCVAHLLVAY